jgi:hypothetical protein
MALTEGKSTGFPIIRDAMAGNGNPEPNPVQKFSIILVLPITPKTSMRL